MKKLLATLLSLTLAITLISTSLVDSIKSPIIDSEISALAYDEEQSNIDSDSSETHEHSYQEVISKNATCAEDGIKTFICNCGYSYEETIPATGHNYVVSIVKPTYSNDGYTLHKCSNCGDEYKDSYIPKLVLSNIKGLKATTTSSSIKLIWNKVKDANGYVIYQNNKKIKTTSGTSYTVSKLKSGTSYKFYVKPYVKSNNKTIYGTQSNVVTTSTNPEKVSFKLTSDTKSATVKWSKVTGATGYKVYYKTSAKGKWKLLKTTNNKTVSYKKSGLTSGKTYWFTVKAYRNANGKIYSGTYSAKSVKIKEIKAKSVKLSKSKISIQRGNSYTLKATVNPKNTTDKITWTSSNKKVATVSSKGVVKGIKKGTVTITAKINGKKATCKVTITKRKTKSIKLSKSKATLEVGKTLKLSRTVNPSNSDEGVVWSSSNSSVASIKIQGQTCIVTGKKKGTAIITAKSGSKKATCKVTVKGMNVEQFSQYLNKKYSSIQTPIGNMNLWFDIHINTNSMFPYDIWIQTGSYDSLAYEISYNITYSHSQKQRALNILKNLQWNIYLDAVNNFPTYKIEGGFYKGFYKYPHLQVGYESTRYLTWRNFENKVQNKYSMAPLANSYYQTKRVNKMIWDNWLDDYKFENYK